MAGEPGSPQTIAWLVATSCKTLLPCHGPMASLQSMAETDPVHEGRSYGGLHDVGPNVCVAHCLWSPAAAHPPSRRPQHIVLLLFSEFWPTRTGTGLGPNLI